jgi:methylated-DNA-[protein]-cysteine S-methyltransferase
MPTTDIGYTLFDTDFGPCGIAWSAAGVTRVRLPGGKGLEERLRASTGLTAASEPPSTVAAVIARLKRYFAGDPVEFADAPLDHAGVTAFNAALYGAMRKLRWGETTTYGELARRAGEPNGARAVGKAMGQNPTPVLIPCHRVLAAGDRLGGFSAWGGDVTKERLLVLERVRLPLLI